MYIINYENGIFKSIEIGESSSPEICIIIKELIEGLYGRI